MEKKIKNITNQIVKRYKPEKVFLFGSFATGRAKKNSDVDLLVIKKTKERFTKRLLQKIEKRGVKIEYITLHVGLGTFQPVKEEDIAKHKMHSEFFELNEKTADALNKAKKSGKKIVACGTTSTRVLECLTDKNGVIKPKNGSTDIFIYPGYKFKFVDHLITNFHTPKSTLLMLVSAFADKKTIDNTYKLAIKKKYHFYSFGDAMLIL